MIRKKLFEKLGMFNEGYINCFEDVELNLKSIVSGYKNYMDNNSVAYHHESKTRNEDPDNLKKLNQDYVQRLHPFIINNFPKIQSYFSIR